MREALISSGVELFPFDLEVVRAMEQQDKQEYKPPWAVVGSTDAYLEAGLLARARVRVRVRVRVTMRSRAATAATRAPPPD